MVDTPTLVKRSDRSSIYISDSFLFSSDEVGWGVSSACFMINDFLKYIFYVCLMFIIVKINNEFFFSVLVWFLKIKFSSILNGIHFQ
jgi:hypothetical protein